MNRNAIGKLVLLLGVFLLVGCAEEDRYREVAQVAVQAADRQAQQNTEMASLNREVAKGTRRMVEADAEARHETIMVHQEIQAERVLLNEGFEKLEAERKQIAQQRRTESVLAPTVKIIGVALVAAAVVGFCWLLLIGSRKRDATDAKLNELLIHELVRDQPGPLSGPGTRATIENRQIDSTPPLLSAADQERNETNAQGDPT